MKMEWKTVSDDVLEYRCDEYDVVIWRTKDGTWACLLAPENREPRTGQQFRTAVAAKEWCDEQMFNDRVRDLVSNLASRLPRSKHYH
ncbi:hypothetical protein [Chthonobacter rhizosphaerae]|uniref:hypothetical protein n=1 Tax=Chthonobacter rhizosphaerae TaxID=2735553 RepID=UPI0015EE71EC|nr:hypothetical protein [Chthonobacter rhizosphaerae]